MLIVCLVTSKFSQDPSQDIFLSRKSAQFAGKKWNKICIEDYFALPGYGYRGFFLIQEKSA